MLGEVNKVDTQEHWLARSRGQIGHRCVHGIEIQECWGSLGLVSGLHKEYLIPWWVIRTQEPL